MVNLSIKITFSLLAVVFILMLAGMLFFEVITILPEAAGPIVLFSEWAALFLLGTILIILTLKKKVAGSLKKFLLLTGASAAGFTVFVILHNLVSGLLSVLFNKEIEEPVFFLLAVFASPLGFLTGFVGSIVLFFKQRNRA